MPPSQPVPYGLRDFDQPRGAHNIYKVSGPPRCPTQLPPHFRVKLPSFYIYSPCAIAQNIEMMYVSLAILCDSAHIRDIADGRRKTELLLVVETTLAVDTTADAHCTGSQETIEYIYIYI